MRYALKYDLLMLLTAAVWGFAFVAQRLGMDHVGPFIFNALRFAMGSLVLIPFIFLTKSVFHTKYTVIAHIKVGVIAGLIIFGGATLQQIGMVYTSAGNAGFLTGFSVILVPVFGIFLKHHTTFYVWVGAILALIGLYFLSVSDQATINPGDIMVFLSAVFWASHIIYIGNNASSMHPLSIASIQFATVAVLSIFPAFAFETNTFDGIFDATYPILYGGLMSAGVGYTLQVVAQRHAPVGHAAIILSLESVFAVLGGWLLLSEDVSSRTLLGCGLALAGMLVAQAEYFIKKSVKAQDNRDGE